MGVVSVSLMLLLNGYTITGSTAAGMGNELRQGL